LRALERLQYLAICESRLLHLQNSLLTRKFYFSQRWISGGITTGFKVKVTGGTPNATLYKVKRIIPIKMGEALRGSQDKSRLFFNDKLRLIIEK
ncbi:hypothetical protein, partial [Burkholderia cenocepacia]|uniref:hypothetical protein n=1 Tax=Burkholderia cenocepacia TaxID=95486 RepID=UPI001B9D3F06